MQIWQAGESWYLRWFLVGMDLLLDKEWGAQLKFYRLSANMAGSFDSFECRDYLTPHFFLRFLGESASGKKDLGRSRRIWQGRWPPNPEICRIFEFFSFLALIIGSRFTLYLPTIFQLFSTQNISRMGNFGRSYENAKRLFSDHWPYLVATFPQCNVFFFFVHFRTLGMGFGKWMQN